MKKALTILAAVITAASMLTACGKADTDEKSSVEESKTASSETTEEDEEYSPLGTEIAAIEEETTEPETEPPTEEETEAAEEEEEKKVSKDKKADPALIGVWESPDSENRFVFGEKRKFGLEFESTSQLWFDQNGVVHTNDPNVDYSKYTTYDGETITIELEGQVMLKLKRTGAPNPDSAYGEYKCEEGILLDPLAKVLGVAVNKCSVYIEENRTFIGAMLSKYSVVDGKLYILSNGLQALGLPPNSALESDYTVNDTTLSLYIEGHTMTFTKIRDIA